jgi:hypothetical protein
MTAHDSEHQQRKLVASSTLISNPLCTPKQQNGTPRYLSQAHLRPNKPLTIHRSNPKHTSRAVGRKGLLQKVHRAQAPPKRRRRGQRCRSPAQSPLEQSNHEDASRTRVLARATREASAKHHRRSWQACQQQQCQQRLGVAPETTKLPPTDLRT